MRALLAPRAIAIVGASAQPGSLGQRLLTNIRKCGFAGPIYPVNPGQDSIDGLRAYPSVAAIPQQVDCAAFAVSDTRIEQALAEAAQAGVRGAVVYGRLYEPPGGSGPNRPQRLAGIAQAAGMAMCGGNCMGFINARDRVVLSGNPPPLAFRPGRIAIISHSGSTWSGLVGSQRDLDITYAVSIGQELAGTMADHIDYILAEEETRAIGLVIETIRDPEGFAAAARRALAKGVPIVALKLGRSALGQRFALSHSGALAGSAEIYMAWLAELGIPVCTTLDQMTDMLELMSCRRRPAPGALGAATDSGAERQLVVDLAADIDCPIAKLGPATEARLVDILDPGMVPENPVDVFGDGKMVLGDCLDAVADDPAVAMVAMVTNMVHGRPYLTSAVTAIEASAARTDKPIVVLANLHSTISREAATRLRDQDIPVLMGTETGLRAIRAWLRWNAGRDRRPEPAPAASPAIAERWRARLRGGGITPAQALELYGEFGGPVVVDAQTTGLPATLAAAERLGYPVVLKTANPAIAHKTEAGGVVLGIADGAALAAAHERVARACGPLMTVQKQVAPGVELFLGLITDEQLGPAITIGFGGIFVEVFRDTVTVIPPISARKAQEVIKQLRCYPLLAGARGRPPVDLAALGEAIAAFSRLAAVLAGELAEFDINPLVCSPSGLVAIDALAVTKGQAT